MPLITSYITQGDGTTTVVISGVELGDKETLLLDNGFDVEVDVNVVDPFQITDKQRRKIFALCNDIEQHTGVHALYVYGLCVVCRGLRQAITQQLQQDTS